jgi:hypothetical protein
MFVQLQVEFQFIGSFLVMCSELACWETPVKICKFASEFVSSAIQWCINPRGFR